MQGYIQEESLMEDSKLLLLKRALHEIQTLKKEAAKHQNESIAIIGMACRFPGGCDTPEAFWEFLKNGGDGVGEVPANRFNMDRYYDEDASVLGKTYVKEGGFLTEDIRMFDANFFGISPREAIDLDPQQRLLLELSWEALERAGIPPKQLKNTQTGVFIGQIGSEYGFFQPHPLDEIGPYGITGMLPNITSGRIAHHFGLHGQAITVDTACSSSLVSAHLACNSLQNGECDLALVGGVSLMISPELFVMLSKVHALARNGRCKSFDASADGYGRGEGAGVLVLKRMSDAIRDRDLILGEIIGSALNQDGPSSGLTVPNGFAQQQVIHNALAKAKITPEQIGYFEAHGTGTSLGDPIELQSINAEFSPYARKNPLYIGSVKANIGHLEAAAGVAGIIKIVLSFQNKTIAPNIHLNTLNPRIDLTVIPAIIPLEPVSWDEENEKRIACINSFGFSGTNGHMILSEGTNGLAESAVKSEHLLVLSALDNNALHQMVKNYHQFLQNDGEKNDVGDICFSANTGRQHFTKRIAFVAENKAALKISMNNYLNNIVDDNVTFEPSTDISIPENTSESSLSELATFYCLGADLNWDEIYPKEQFKKVILPTYPFQRKPYWFEPSEKGMESIIPAKSGNPLLGTTFSSPMEKKQFTFAINLENMPELKDTHNLMHVGYFMEMIKLNLKLSDFTVVFIEFISAITFVKGKEKLISLIVSPSGDALDLQFFTQDDVSSPWTLHVTAQIKPELTKQPVLLESIETIQSRSTLSYGCDEFYDGLAKRGVTVGDSVRWIGTIWANKGEALTHFKAKVYNPGIWDACAQLFHAALIDEEAMFMVHRWEQVLVKSLPEKPEALWCHIKLKGIVNPGVLCGSFVLFNAKGEAFIQCADFAMHAVNQQWMAAFLQSDDDHEQEESALLIELDGLDSEQQVQRLCGYLLDAFSNLLAIPKEELSIKSSLNEMGIDSIINLTLKNDFLKKTGINIPIALLMESMTIETLAKSLISLITQRDITSIKTPLSPEDKSNLWFDKPSEGSQKIRLFCFPYGGGGASLYKDWQGKMPANITIVPVQLPGRENRFQEEPFTNISPLLDTLYDIISPECNTPFAFYGHSAGGLIAYRLMKKLIENPEYEKNSKQLFVAAYSSPLMHPNPWYQQFILKLQRAGFQGVPDLAELRQCNADQLTVFMELMELGINIEQYAGSEKDLEFIKLILSKLLADLQLVESYKHSDIEHPLSVPLTVFHGDNDDRVCAEDMQAWKSLTSSRFNYVNLPGDHFFLHKDQSQDLLIKTIIKMLVDD